MMFPAYEKANAELTEGDISSLMKQWDERLIGFALSFDGYEYTANQPGNVPASRLAGFVRPVVRVFAEIGSLPSSLSLCDLRACLFWEQRRDRHTGLWKIEGKQFDYIQALLAAIKAKIRAGEIE
ncbi:MAG: hypothetical protein ACRELF_00500 [Gemmataceae bacterium]